MGSKLVLKIFVRLLAFSYKESLMKLQLLLVKGKVWRELLEPRVGVGKERWPGSV